MNSTSILPTKNQSTIALIMSALAAFLTPFLGSSLNISLPAIAREYSLSAVSLSWVSLVYLLGAGILLIPFGKLADMKGRKKVFRVGITVLTLACLATPFSPNGTVLIALRFIQGLGASMIFSTSMAILVSVFPLNQRGKVLGINVASVYSGLSLGPVVGGFLTHYAGWRSIFIFDIIVGIIAIWLSMQLKGEWKEPQSGKFDGVGGIILCFSLAAVIYGLSKVMTGLGMGIAAAGVIGLISFVMWETRVEDPLLEVRLFKNVVFAMSNLASLINYSATYATEFLVSLYLQYIKAMTPQHAAFILLSQPVLMVIFSPFAGKLSDRVEPRIISSIGMGCCVIGLFMFGFIHQQSPVYIIILSLIFLGTGFGLFSSPNTNAVMSSVEKKYYGIASGTIGTMRLAGQMFSMSMSTLAFSIFMGSRPITPSLYPSFLKAAQTLFLSFSFLCLLGVFASLARGNLRKG
jgi:EmrB/QacA subfamily drug resistance transporter